MEFFKKQIRHKSTTIILICAIMSGGFALQGRMSEKGKKEQKHNSKIQPSPDTYIPPGFVLVPIEIQNTESLNAVLGDRGVVDLYASNIDPNKAPRKIAKRIKILRSPLNPDIFAVLAPENRAKDLVRFDAPMYAIVQNPKQDGTEFQKKTITKPQFPTIHYDISGDDQ